MRVPVRLGSAENSLIAQLNSVGATADAERLGIAGLPTRRVEAYLYTDLKMLLKTVPPLAAVAAVAGAPGLDVAGPFRLVIDNGRVGGHAAPPAGAIVGKAKGAALTERDDILVRLNSALASESLTLTLEGEVAPVIHIDRRTSGEAAHSASSARIFIADGGSATVLETYSGNEAAHLANHATFIQVGKGATLTHITLDLSGKTATHFATHEYLIAEDAKLRTLAIHAGAVLERTQIFAQFAGDRKSVV